MSQSTYIAASIVIAFIVFIVAKGSAPVYLAIFSGAIGPTPLADTKVDLGTPETKSGDSAFTSEDKPKEGNGTGSGSGSAGGGGGGWNDNSVNGQSDNTSASPSSSGDHFTLSTDIISGVASSAFGSAGNAFGLVNDFAHGDFGGMVNTGIGIAAGVATGGMGMGSLGSSVFSGVVSGFANAFSGEKK